MTETWKNMDRKVTVIYIRDNKCYVGNKNKLCIFDLDTLVEEEIDYKKNSSIDEIKSSGDGSVVHVLHEGGDVASVHLETKTTVIVVANAALMAAGEPDELFTCNRSKKNPGNIDRWNTKNGQRIATLTGYMNHYFGMVYLSQAKKLATCNDSRKIQVWDVYNDTHVILGGDDDTMYVYRQISKITETTIVATLATGYLMTVDIHTLQPVVKRSAQSLRNSVLFMFVVGVLDRRYVVVSHPDFQWKLLDLHTGNHTSSYKFIDYRFNAVVSDDGRIVAHDASNNSFCIKKLDREITPPLVTGDLCLHDDNHFRPVGLHRASGIVTVNQSNSFVVTAATNVEPVGMGFIITIDSNLRNDGRTRKRKLDNDSNVVTFIVHTKADLDMWIEGFNAVIASKALPPGDKTLIDNSNIIEWYRMRQFDQLQLIKHRQNHRGLFGLAFPRDAMHLIGSYLLLNKY